MLPHDDTADLLRKEVPFAFNKPKTFHLTSEFFGVPMSQAFRYPSNGALMQRSAEFFG
jgi:hypothetical protein